MIIVRAPRTMSGRIASVMRLRASAGACFSHRTFGTVAEHRAAVETDHAVAERDQLEIAQRVPPDAGVGAGDPRLRAGDCRLLQLDEHAVRAEVNEGDQRAFGAGPRLLVDQPRASRLQLRERGADVVDAQRDVVQARAALVGVLRDRRIGRGRLEQLQLRFADRQKVGADALRGDLFGRFDLEPKRVAVERERRRQVAHRDADVIEDGLHEWGRGLGESGNR